MTVTSANGYSANDRTLIASFTIPRTGQKVALRTGDTSKILLDLLAWIHLHIEPLDVGIFDDWGYAERTIRGSSTTLSNHASGTAVDANATQHPLGVRGTWTPEERRLINARLALYEGCIRWGDNYDGRVDGMHFEINRGAADCRRVADRIRAGQLDQTAPQEDDMTAQFEADSRAMWSGMKPGALAALERDLRGDLAVKAGQLSRLEVGQDAQGAALTALTRGQAALDAKVTQLITVLTQSAAAQAPATPKGP